jgi:hypothetical protein
VSAPQHLRPFSAAELVEATGDAQAIDGATRPRALHHCPEHLDQPCPLACLTSRTVTLTPLRLAGAVAGGAAFLFVVGLILAVLP